MDLMGIRRMLISMTGDDTDMNIQKVTINSEPNTTEAVLVAIWNAIGTENKRWIAWVDSASYMTDSNVNICAVVANLDYNVSGNLSYNQCDAWRTDNSYYNMRKMAIGATSCSVPVGTVFNVFIFPA